MSLRAKPMHVLCKYVGVAPYSFDPRSRKIKFSSSKFGLTYSAIISILLAFFAVLNYRTTKGNLHSGSYVTIVAQWLQFYVNNGFSIAIVVANSLQQWKVVKVFNALYDPKNQPTQIPDDTGPTKDVVYGTVVVVITISLHLLTTLTSYFDNEKRIDCYWFPYGILFLLNTLVVLQFLYAVVKLGNKFHDLGVRLEDCIEDQRNRFSARTFNDSDKRIAGLTTVEKIADEHFELVLETDSLNSAFSYQLLLCFVSALMISVTGFYLICKRIIQLLSTPSAELEETQRENSFDWWALSCYPLLHSLLLGSIIGVCHWTVNQSNLINRVLPRVQRAFRITEYSSIDGFHHQLSLHQISFNVFHLFAIEPSMICSIITTVLTYLIILVQFEISQKIEDTQTADALSSEPVFYNFTY